MELEHLIAEAKQAFDETSIKLPSDDRITKVEANEVDKFFRRFRPEEWLSTLIVNLLILFFD